MKRARLENTVEEMDTRPAPPVAEENVYTGVYRVLLVGMAISTALFVGGVVAAFLHPGYVPLRASWVRGHYHWSVVLHGLATADPVVLMMLGTVVLILTPIVRVVISTYAFYVDHDYKYVAVTGAVLLVLILSFVAGRLGLS